MQKYEIENSIGNGNFSTVFKAQMLESKQPCAIKIMRSHPKIALREAQLLRKFKHPNIITIFDFEQNEQESKLILEYIGINTLELYEKNNFGLKEEQVKCILFQAALGLSCVHSYGIIHRDIKPENILIDKKLAIVKLIDFGLAIDERQVSTDYIATRWYRAPENLLGTKEYTCAIDVFSLGCVIVELYLGSPLFPGANNLDQIFKIFNVLGYPTQENWPKGYEKMIELGVKINSGEKNKQINLRSIMSQCDSKLVDIIEKMLQFNPKNRIKCHEILKHEYFRDIKGIIPPAVWKKFSEDILQFQTDQGLKAFENVKSSRNTRIENFKKVPQINFHQVGNKPRQKQHIEKIVEKPNFFRQKKSTSLDSIQLFKQEVRLPNKISVVQPQNQQINRKLSTPLLISNSAMEYSKKMIKNFSFAGQSIKTDHSLNEEVRRFVKSKHIIESIPEEEDSELKGSTFVPDLSETAHSQISRNYNKNSMELDQKNLKPFAIGDNDKKVYPFINNVPFAQDLPLERTSFKIPNRIFSPPANLNFINQSFTSSEKNLESHRSPNHLSYKPYMNSNNQQAQKPFVNSNCIPNLNESMVKNYLIKPETHSKPNLLIPEQINLRPNFHSPNSINKNFEFMSARPYLHYQSPNSNTNRVFFSPPQRCIMQNQNDFRQEIRQKRIVAIDEPKPFQQFFSPRHHNF